MLWAGNKKCLFYSLKETKDDKTTTRIIVTRSEIDLSNIKKAFAHMYRKELRECVEVSSEWILHDISGLGQHLFHRYLGGQKSDWGRYKIVVLRDDLVSGDKTHY